MKNFIKDYRIKKNLTQERLAELIGTSKVQISRLETGERRLNMDWLEKIAKALGVREGALISDMSESENGYNKDIIADIFVTVEEFLLKNKRILPSKDKIELVFALYNRVADLTPEERRAKIIDLTDFRTSYQKIG